MPIRKSLVAVLVGVSTLGLVQQASAGGLGGNAIAKLFPGQFEAQFKGYRVFFTGQPNGQLSGQAYGQQDTGRWFVKSGALCVAWKNWTNGQAKCGALTQQNGWYVASSSAGDVLKFRRTAVAMR